VVEQDAGGPDGSVRDVVVLQEVNCSCNVVDEPHNLYFLKEEVDELPLLGRQSVDLIVVTQFDFLDGLYRVAAHATSQSLQRRQSFLHDSRQTALRREIRKVDKDRSALPSLTASLPLLSPKMPKLS
jgi:hypothetical protein